MKDDFLFVNCQSTYSICSRRFREFLRITLIKWIIELGERRDWAWLFKCVVIFQLCELDFKYLINKKKFNEKKKRKKSKEYGQRAPRPDTFFYLSKPTIDLIVCHLPTFFPVKIS
jgi:hypothetical protein